MEALTGEIDDRFLARGADSVKRLSDHISPRERATIRILSTTKIISCFEDFFEFRMGAGKVTGSRGLSNIEYHMIRRF